jgi:hypothetical protein
VHRATIQISYKFLFQSFNPNQFIQGGKITMKMLLEVQFPHEPFNALVRSGEVGNVIGRVLEEIRPEAVYFTESHGHRSGLFLLDVKEASDVPKFAEPFFLKFNAECRFRIVMDPEQLRKAGLEDIGKKWK